jgi:glycine cleavage system transcriptional repressor
VGHNVGVTLHAITVLGHDRPGIIAEATGRLAELGLNLEDSSMTRLRGHFAMTLICEGEASHGTLSAALAPLAGDGTLTVTVHELPLAGELYLLIAEVDLPTDVDAAGLEEELKAVAADLGVGVTLREAEADEL